MELVVATCDNDNRFIARSQFTQTYCTFCRYTRHWDNISGDAVDIGVFRGIGGIGGGRAAGALHVAEAMAADSAVAMRLAPVRLRFIPAGWHHREYDRL